MAELNSTPAKLGGRSQLKKMPVRVDLTAMVDLAFLLITFFMLTTSLTKPRAMPLVMPAAGAPGAVSDKSTMTLCLGKNNHVLYYLGIAGNPLTEIKVIDGNKVRDAIIETREQVLKATGKPLMVLVKPGDHSVYANLIDALDEISITQVPSYAVVALSAKDKELLKQNGIY